jgi:hypothetical protein
LESIEGQIHVEFDIQTTIVDLEEILSLAARMLSLRIYTTPTIADMGSEDTDDSDESYSEACDNRKTFVWMLHSCGNEIWWNYVRKCPKKSRQEFY